MRKPKHIIAGLALTSLLLVGCANDLKRDNVGNVVTVTIDNNEVKIPAGELFDDYLKTPAGLRDYYDAVYQVVVRALFEKDEQRAKRTEIYDKAGLRINEVKEQAKNNAKGGGNYDDELESILDSNNVETIKELEEKYAYEYMQEELKLQFYDGGEGAWIENAMEELIVGEKDANDNLVYEGYLSNKLPYHVRHLLVKVSAANNEFVKGQITRGEAIKLSQVVRALVERQDTFGTLANRFSEDEGSAANFGDLGIMTTSTSYVNEFKLGVYAFDALYNNDPVITNDDREKLNVPEGALDGLEDLYGVGEAGIGQIPYGAALKLYEHRNDETAKLSGLKVNDGEALYFPRNIIFNNFFNQHNVSVITPDDVDAAGAIVADAGFAALAGFSHNVEINGKKALTDEKGNVILVVRAGASGSYEGVHFIVVERSAILETENGVSLQDYYTLETPGSASFPTDVNGDELDTFVNFLNLDAVGIKGRVDTIKNEVKSFDPNIDDRIFNKLVEELDVKFSDPELKAALDTYLDNQYARTQYNQDVELEIQWAEWIEYLGQQEDMRGIRLIPYHYIAQFLDGVDFDWETMTGKVA